MHLADDRYRRQTAWPGSDAPRSPAGSTTQLVFAITRDLAVHRAHLRSTGIAVGELERYPGFAYQIYEGRDPEGNVFQVIGPD
ncbi:hypothetical protein XVE_2969 [Xanthomonas vesicatoria ATCC 35937]|uniref:VOC domain-containing protein n=1 Tax=Xanthomonas vesicatoria ATCC 35937 TaxID=925775 RepID=F0BFI5_9XANT|nr:hypothetical protein XVE_2969 [Xanthomonas vesicatoria ATCC 35937]